MSRRRSTSSAMGPPPDRDVVMGPPPVPAPLSTPAPTAQKSARDQEMHEKYRKLKRRFFELEEKHKETTSELQRSSERNVRMREERDHLLDRILELESQVIPNGSPTTPVSAPMPMAQPSSSAFPRTLLNARARTSFIANLREAIAEDDADDDVDPILASRHVGPEARRREEEERRERERLEEEARESQSKKAGRKTRSSHGSSGSHKGKDSASNATAQPLMTFNPSTHQTSGGGSPNHGSPAPVLVSSTGTRLRIKPPKASGSPSPPEQLSPHQHASSSSSSSRGHSHQRSPISTTQPVYTHPPPPPPPHFHHHPHQSPPLQQQHHRQHSLTSEQDEYRSVSPGGGMEVDVKDDPVSSNRELSPPPPSVESSYARHDNQYEDQGRDLPNPERAGNADGHGVSPTFPLRSEVPAPSPPPPAPVEEPVPQRRSTRTRKSTRVAEAQATQRERSPAAPPPAKRARTSSTRAEAKRAEAEAAARARAEAEAQTEAKRIEEEERVKAEEAAAKAEVERLAAEAEAKEKAHAEASTLVEAEVPPIAEVTDAPPISEAEENVTSTVAVAEGEISPESRSPSPQGPTPPERYDSLPSPIHDSSPPPAAQSPAPELAPATATTVVTTVSEDVQMEDATQPAPEPETATTDVPETQEDPVRELTPVSSPPQVARSPTPVRAPAPAPVIDEPAPPAPVPEDVSMEDVSQLEEVNAPQPVEKEPSPVPPAPAPTRDHEPSLPTPPAEAQAIAAASLPTPVSASADIPHPVPEVAAPAPSDVPETASVPDAVVQAEAAPVSHETTPEMENIVKVAEAAIAAQNAAANANARANANEIHAPQPSAPAPPPVQENSNIDPNLDPSLAAVSANQLRKESGTPASASSASAPAPSSTPGPLSAPAAPNVVTTNGYVPASNGSASASPAPPTPSAASPSTPSPSLSGNPYLSLSTMIPKMPATGSPTPTSAVGSMGPLGPMNPYSMYYPPGTPITPTTPGYPHPYNPYYYLAAPMPGPSGMYPSSPSYTPSASRPPSDVQRHAKPKRLKAHTVTSKSYSIPMVPRDKKGKPMLPLNVGIMTVINLGAVCMREHFHTERYIFPVGYEVTRRYLSTIDPNVEVVYHCTILDGGDGPKFQIVPSDIPDRPVIAGTATGAWSSIVKQANAIRNRQHSNSVSGPDFFGLGQNTIKHLIQELPNANRLRDYVWQNFVEGGPLGGRHAAVIPALPEEYDASHPIGAYYPSLGDRLKREAAAASPSSPRGIHHYPQHIQAQARAAAAAAAAEQQGNQPSTSPPPQQQQQQQPPSQGGILHPPQSQQSPVNMLPGPFPDYRAAPPQMAPDASRPLADTRANSNTPGLTPPPAVPATFASIMNAYPVPGSAPPNQPGGSSA